MASKISGVDTRTGPVGAGRPVERARDATTEGRAAPEAGADVHITGTARQLAEVEQLVKEMPAVDEARVAAVSAALAEGRYQIIPEHIASRLLELEQALGSAFADEPASGVVK